MAREMEAEMRRQVKMKQQRELVEKKARAKEAEMRRQREPEEKNTSRQASPIRFVSPSRHAHGVSQPKSAKSAPQLCAKLTGILHLRHMTFVKNKLISKITKNHYLRSYC